tara:strand:- start:9 stop:428 length:420 start_codon:yes stop_codon:yes gene_type:complete
MARFAKLGFNGKVVGVHVVNDTDCQNADGVEDEKVGQDFLQRIHGWEASMWKRTSYNTFENQHKLGGTPFRKNFAGIGDTYDEVRDAFYKPQPYVSWTLNETTCAWEPPIAQPSLTVEEKTAGKSYEWNESTGAWDLIE